MFQSISFVKLGTLFSHRKHQITSKIYEIAIRSITVFISKHDDTHRELNEFADRAEMMGCDPYPNFRKVKLIILTLYLNIKNRKH